MATLLFTAVGTLVGGPLGGALGALAGRQIDGAVFGTPSREGPRLKELAISTSSYGTPIARHFGRMRAPGTIIWATDLAEHSAQEGGGKGRPGVTSYSYTISLAVALASRPIAGIGRIWADGSLLRGAAGDMKTGGTLRIHRGFDDQRPDPLVAAAEVGRAPAFRGLAYAVFEDLQLEDFGNRVPALSFEIIADDGAVSLAQMMQADLDLVDRDLPGLAGYSDEGGTLRDTLAAIDLLYPIACDAGGAGLSLAAADAIPAAPPMLPPPAASPEQDAFGMQGGSVRRRDAAAQGGPAALRYYDIARAFQPGVQRADGRGRAGPDRTVEFPGAFAAQDARGLANSLRDRAEWSRETLSWRMAELDPRFAPGQVTRAPGHAGLWRIESWEWREHGIELELRALPPGPSRTPLADAGTALLAPDRIAVPTILRAFEMPWDGVGPGDQPTRFAAVSAAGSAWGGAQLYTEQGGQLAALGPAGRSRCTIGALAGALPASPALRFEAAATLDVQLFDHAQALDPTTLAGLAAGDNRALIGHEIVQFAAVAPLGNGMWRLLGMLRGRGGTEGAALAGHSSGAPFILLDERLTSLDPARTTPAEGLVIAAIGRADREPVRTALTGAGTTLRPLTPVHPKAVTNADGSLTLSWTRRARGAWRWDDRVDVPLVEQSEAWLVGLGPVDAPIARWELSAPGLTIAGETLQTLRSVHFDAVLWVRQIGSFAMSDPCLLTDFT